MGSARLARAAVLVLLGAVAAGSELQARRVRPASEPVRFDAVMVARAGEWARVTERTARAEVNVDALTIARYRRADGALLQLTLAASGDARRQFEMHYPDVCHELRGDAVNALGTTVVPLAAGGAWPARAFSWSQPSYPAGALCLYGVVFGGRAVPHSLAAKWTQLSASVLGKTLAGHVLRVDVFAPTDNGARLSAALDFLTALDASLDAPLRVALFGRIHPAQSILESP